MTIPRQCVILVGGLGSRLGSLTANTPKPLLDVGGRPFLAWILREVSRFGIRKVLLLAGHQAEAVAEFCSQAQHWLPKPMDISVSVEPAPAGTGGALWHARDLLEDTFLMLNGDSWFDTNLASLIALAASEPQAIGAVLLRDIEDASRYGAVALSNTRITAFGEKSSGRGRGCINAGIYLFRRDILAWIAPHCSLERDVLPKLADAGKLAGTVADGYFIDIGIPADYERANAELPRRFFRPAVFFDRDGVLNADTGWVGTIDRFAWLPTGKQALRTVANAGWHAFVVTNQAGVAKGKYTEKEVADLHEYVEQELLTAGATVDEILYCPDHPEGIVPRYRRDSAYRKPAPGMILDLVERWNARKDECFLIGDKQSDLQAARAAGIPGFLFEGGDLNAFLGACSERFKSAQSQPPG